MNPNLERMDRQRILAGLTKRGLAELVGVQEGTIYRLFKGQSRSPGLIRKVCDAIGLPTHKAYQVEDHRA